MTASRASAPGVSIGSSVPDDRKLAIVAWKLGGGPESPIALHGTDSSIVLPETASEPASVGLPAPGVQTAT